MTGASGYYSPGTQVSISAEAYSGYSFAGWIVAGGGSVGNASNKSTTFTMPANTVTITATFTNFNSGILYGDLNNDNRVNISDLILMLKYFSQPNVFINMAAADVNGDSVVNNNDLNWFLRYFSRPGVKLGP